MTFDPVAHARLVESRKRETGAFVALLEGASVLKIRELALKALREWRKDRPSEETFSTHGDLGIRLVPLVGDLKGLTSLDANMLKEYVIRAQAEPGAAAVFEFLAWFIAAGLGVPVAWEEQHLVRLQLTARGKELLATTEDHPLLPGFVQRLAARCPGLPSGIPSLLADAQRCHEQLLLRPAVVMLGVAYETATEAVADSLVKRGKLTQVDEGAAKRISSLRAVVDSAIQKNDDRYAARRALDVADDLRRRRNDASHTAPTYGFEDRAEVEELLVSAARALPNLWMLH